MLRYIVICLCLLSLFSCGQKFTKVILLPQTSGKTGAVSIKTQGPPTTLDKPYTMISAIDKTSKLVAKKVDPEKIKKLYAGLFKHELKLPGFEKKPEIKPRSKTERFGLYFNSGSDGGMTKESKFLLSKILKRIKQRTPCKIRVIGHTDSVGPADSNIDLSLKRARQIKELLKPIGKGQNQIYVHGYGEYSPKVRTPDETPEAKNRRVDVIIR
jgi:peptidoglycan-associated lipoprotein